LRQSQYSLRAAQTLNAVAKADIEEAAALDALATAKEQYGANSEQANAAGARYAAATQAATETRIAQRQAAGETAVARIAPGDAVAIARARLSLALQNQREAARFGTSSTQYQQATQQVIEAQRTVNDSLFGITTANSNLAIAMANAAGNTVEASRLQLSQAREALREAQRKSGGKRTADVIGAEAGVVQAEAAKRDAVFTDQLDTINFNKQMENTTTAQAITQLQELLRMKDLTKQQRRQVELQIKGLEDELASAFEGQWNLGDIKTPTPYEMRRAIGIDGATAGTPSAASSMIGASGVQGFKSGARGFSQASDVGGLVAQLGEAATSQSQTVQISIDGADVAMVKRILSDYLGPGATGRGGSTYRKG
jgi:hypothetical protein